VSSTDLTESSPEPAPEDSPAPALDAAEEGGDRVTLAGVLAERLRVWATELLDRDDPAADLADIVMAREVLALPVMSGATAASAPILEAVAAPPRRT